MTTTTTTSRWTYTGDASTTVFPYTNKIFAKTDLVVSVAGVTQTVDTDYTVSGVGNANGGNVTFTTAPANAAQIVIVRNVPSTQEASLPLGGPFPSVTVEDAIDKLTILHQQKDSEDNRRLRLSATDPAASINELPVKTELASNFLAFDGNGDPIAAVGTSANLGPVSAYIDTLLDDADAAAARVTLGLGTLAVQDELDAVLTAQVFS